MKEKIIVLRTFKWRESDLMVHGLTAEGARLSFLARGALRSKKRFGGGVLEPTRFIMAHYKPQASRDNENPLHTLQEAQILRDFEGLRQVYERLEVGLFMVGLMDKVAQPGISDAPELFDLLGNGLKAAESAVNLEVLRLQFEVKLLYLLGVLPTHGLYAELLRHALSEHQKIELESDDLRRLRTETKLCMQRYLEGR